MDGSSLKSPKAAADSATDVAEGAVGAEPEGFADLRAEVLALKSVCDALSLSQDVGLLNVRATHGEHARDKRGHKDLERRIVDRNHFKEQMVNIDGKGGEEEARAFTFNLKMFL